jgi:hypothetical protein
MKQEILDVYGKFDINNLPDFFDNLIYLTRKYKKNFYKYVENEFLEKMVNYKSDDFIIGHSDDFFDKGIRYYVNNFGEYSEKEIILQVSGLIWSLCVYMINQECPACHQANLRLLERSGKIYEFCEECLFKSCNGSLVKIEEELFPAKKELVLNYLFQKNERR